MLGRVPELKLPLVFVATTGPWLDSEGAKLGLREEGNDQGCVLLSVAVKE